uniref:Putative ovule protein n=1 Tax=Solanum chacoense TaxID=4108 RepID=A0A0V0GZ10_SOLCH
MCCLKTYFLAIELNRLNISYLILISPKVMLSHVKCVGVNICLFQWVAENLWIFKCLPFVFLTMKGCPRSIFLESDSLSRRDCGHDGITIFEIWNISCALMCVIV